MLNHAEILGIINIRSSFVFLNWHIFARSGFLHQMIFPTTGMRARPLIRISACKVIAQQASAGIGNAHCAMHKGFDFHILRNAVANLADFLHRKLTRHHNALCAQLIPHLCGFIVRVVRLRGNMNLHIGNSFLCNRKYTQIGNNQRIYANGFHRLEIVRHPFKIGVMCENICCYINLYAMVMGKFYPLRHGIYIEIFCLGTQTIRLAADINGIRTIKYSNFQLF